MIDLTKKSTLFWGLTCFLIAVNLPANAAPRTYKGGKGEYTVNYQAGTYRGCIYNKGCIVLGRDKKSGPSSWRNGNYVYCAKFLNMKTIEQKIMKVLTGLVTALIIIAGQSVMAQRSTPTLSQAWQEGNGFASFDWLSAKDKEEMYSSAVYTEVNQNTLSIYNTYNRAPLGQYAMCGGLGCDLGKGQLVATLKFEPRGKQFVVREASSKAKFLAGAQCRLIDSYMVVLECTSNKTPQSRNMPSIFRFSPGT